MEGTAYNAELKSRKVSESESSEDEEQEVPPMFNLTCNVKCPKLGITQLKGVSITTET